METDLIQWDEQRRSLRDGRLRQRGIMSGGWMIDVMEWSDGAAGCFADTTYYIHVRCMYMLHAGWEEYCYDVHRYILKLPMSPVG